MNYLQKELILAHECFFFQKITNQENWKFSKVKFWPKSNHWIWNFNATDLLYIFIKIVERLWSYRKCPTFQVKKWSGRVVAKKCVRSDNPGKNIWHKVKKYSKTGYLIWYLILRVSELLLPKFDFWKKDRTLGFVSTQVLYFSDISQFLKIQGLKSFDNSFGNLCTKFVILNIKCRFTCSDSDLY